MGRLGGFLAALPACLIAPIRTTAMVHRRTGLALLAPRASWDAAEPDRQLAIRRAEGALDQLCTAAAPLLVVPIACRRPEAVRAGQLLAACPHLKRCPEDESAVAALRPVHRQGGLAYRNLG